ncbi:MAG: pyridoxal phosphate-dependent decarboxylase family protein, partial [Desulfocucumaceae bacterium]
AFPSLRKFESEVVSMTAGLLGGGPETAGSMTSCGTESILMAVKTYRDRARAERPEITAPELLMPDSAHPAFQKAAHYFDVIPVRVPVKADFRADVEAMKAAITDNTVLIMGSAPSYPQGVIDPIQELASMALEKGIGFHVDSCLGGFLLPFARKLGYPLPDFDFTVPGVTSISADVHKYGFAAKGASTILYGDKALRRHQYFVYPDWSGGIYASPTMTGTRPGGAIAAAWGIMNFLGEEGYMKIADNIMKSSKKLIEGINAIPGLYVLGQPDLSVFSFAADAVDIYVLGDAMEARGWHLDRQQRPPCLHLMVTPAHEKIVDLFLSDLRECTLGLADEKSIAPQGSAAMYGMMGSLPDRGMVSNFVFEYMDELMKVK